MTQYQFITIVLQILQMLFNIVTAYVTFRFKR